MMDKNRVQGLKADSQSTKSTRLQSAALPVTLRIALPWPPRELSPNARVHWARLAEVKKRYRQACKMAARHQGASKMPDGTPLHVALTFCPPNGNAYDLDNALARMKAGLDGLSDALGVDDRHWSLSLERGGVHPAGGRVLVEVIA